MKPAASVADLVTIELRRIMEVLQVDHASLLLRDTDDPRRVVVLAQTGLPVSVALPEHHAILVRVLHTARAQEVQRPNGPGETSCAALATPLAHEGGAVGALLVVTLRTNRRLNAIDKQVLSRAAQTLVERILVPAGRLEAAVASDRFARDGSAAHG